ncbi:MAG: sugar ABC transporter permease [Spirochaetales bacterium]|nr:sugar ABC transporter permease [Spirochaetales bacterium]
MNRQRKDAMTAFLFILPWIVGFLLFTMIPIFQSLYYSFTKFNLITSPKFIGLENFVRIFTEDERVPGALLNDAFMVFVGLPLGTAFTLILALLLNSPRAQKLSFLKLPYLLPPVVPIIAMAILWRWVVHPSSGLVNTILGFVGIQGPGWLQSELWAKPAIVLFNTFIGSSNVLLYLAALQGIPQSLYEAADMDGASGFQKTLHISVPMIRPMISFQLIMGIIFTMQNFAPVLALGLQGGPNHSTRLFSYHLFLRAFRFYEMGYASAMSWVLMILTFILTFFIFRFTDQFKDE